MSKMSLKIAQNHENSWNVLLWWFVAPKIIGKKSEKIQGSSKYSVECVEKV